MSRIILVDQSLAISKFRSIHWLPTMRLGSIVALEDHLIPIFTTDPTSFNCTRSGYGGKLNRVQRIRVLPVQAHRGSSDLNLRVSTGGRNVHRGTGSTSTEVFSFRPSVQYRIEVSVSEVSRYYSDAERGVRMCARVGRWRATAHWQYQYCS